MRYSIPTWPKIKFTAKLLRSSYIQHLIYMVKRSGKEDMRPDMLPDTFSR
jgi:hypothetical protein